MLRSTELGARHVGIVQSLIVTCRLHAIDPYDYLVDVLQRVAALPAARVAELTPRLWKQHFAAGPLQSQLTHPRCVNHNAAELPLTVHQQRWRDGGPQVPSLSRRAGRGPAKRDW